MSTRFFEEEFTYTRGITGIIFLTSRDGTGGTIGGTIGTGTIGRGTGTIGSTGGTDPITSPGAQVQQNSVATAMQVQQNSLATAMQALDTKLYLHYVLQPYYSLQEDHYMH